MEAVTLICVGLSTFSATLLVTLVDTRRRLRAAEYQAEWNATLATRAKRAMEQQLADVGQIASRLEAETAAWRARLRP